MLRLEYGESVKPQQQTWIKIKCSLQINGIAQVENNEKQKRKWLQIIVNSTPIPK